MSDREYEDELRSEREYVADLYARLDAERARVGAKFSDALREHGGTLIERDVEVRTLGREVQRLDVADNGLCFGRLDALTGERSYVGRIGIYDEANEYEPLLLDWRAPAARPFYVATAISPENMRRRRQFHSQGRELVDFSDEVFGHPGGGERGDAALLAAVNAPRGEGMRDIVATIQAEQDEIIRLSHNGVVVIEGGPGTGKTVVALHRVAYLLYTYRERMEKHGVLVVGPNKAFIRHVGRVLPSLGETSVVFMTPGDFLPGMHVTTEDAPAVARLKGSLNMVTVLKRAVANLQRLPEDPIPIQVGGVSLRIDDDTAEWARDEARNTGLPHNEARAKFREIITYVLTERAIGRLGRGWLSRENRKEWEDMRSSLIAELAASDTFTSMLDRLWPVLKPETFLAELYSNRSRLRAAGADDALWREDGAAWTVSDVSLIDELIEIIGRDPADDAAAARERATAIEHAKDVMDMMVTRQDNMDGEGMQLFANEIMDAERLAERFVERDTRDVAERAASDRDWTYRHVVVDEAQELSEMDWRVLMRRCPTKSFTIVGDLAQRRSSAGATSWGTMLEPHVPGRWAYRTLTMNYRTPAEIMAVAAELLASFAPGVEPPESVRSSGVQPWSRQVSESEIPAAIDQFVAEEAEREGTSIVIGPVGFPGTVPASETKGLEFDSVLVVEPEQIITEGERGAAELYVALTRATQRLGVLHVGPLPDSLGGLAVSGR
ncbi:MAG: AAA family ATPase [Nocardiaceae bacterium]|nr:AAA family ATPase [Nocardiaceae bacterium]